ncbi:lecithin retinol acyltransferase family protein [Paenibacillus doosanensis]|uniref:lecithin retinol acyltransferase family protein n=1 Tax=Paenibacillus doosanensis TaxID=1229154 RepID=UPI00218028FD|nr:lecithin retinol acyltransferase family protein [Paenibacillus doosanensis]MCS7460829.1 lecithin retinol acyltransferase family protein [Paenibacillus doosanensis]
MFWGSKKSIPPETGSIIYTELAFGAAEHSGIYLGYNRVIHLNGQGYIEEVSLHEFTGHITTFNHEIYVPCYSDMDLAVSFPSAAGRAIDKIGSTRDYNVILDNCHQFCAGCVTDDFNNSCNFLWMLKDLVREKHGSSVTWRKWDWKNAS